MFQGRLLLACLLLFLQRVSAIKIEFDEPDSKSVHLGSRTSIRCLVTYEKHLLSVSSVQIVRSQSGQQTVLSKGAKIFESESRYYRVTKLDLNRTRALKLDFNETHPLKLELVFEILSARTVDNAEFKCRYVDQQGNVQAEDGVKLLIFCTPRIDSFTANNRREYLEVRRDSDIEFKCQASGIPSVTLSLLKSTPDGKDELVHISRHRNRLEFEIDDADCRQGGVYRCQIDKNYRSAKKVTVAVNKCGSDEVDSDESTHSKYLVIKVAIPCVCAAVIVFTAVAIVNYVKRCKARKTRSTHRGSGVQLREGVLCDIQEVRGLSPPPYSICQNVVDMAVPRPMYPGEVAACDQYKTKLTTPSSASEKCMTGSSKAGQLHTDAHIDDLPPPYTKT
ncbi:unnamed protein product [Lymnaea stagnalis]|uniref:Ig-like domain-containing protein n=1 Tax=Lymnaea stagnalis TaxID=6523 RepID=A0AAV2H0I7_LYMST